MASELVRDLDERLRDEMDANWYGCSWSVPAGEATDADVAELNAVWSMGGTVEVTRQGDRIVATGIYKDGGRGAMERLRAAVYEADEKFNAKWAVAHGVLVDQPPDTTPEECERFCREESKGNPALRFSYNAEARSICMVDTASIELSGHKANRARAEALEQELAVLRGAEGRVKAADGAAALRESGGDEAAARALEDDALDRAKRLLMEVEDKLSRRPGDFVFTDADVGELERQVEALAHVKARLAGPA